MYRPLMVRAGLAYPYDYRGSVCKNLDQVQKQENVAKEEGVNIWADKELVKPWDYRRRD